MNTFRQSCSRVLSYFVKQQEQARSTQRIEARPQFAPGLILFVTHLHQLAALPTVLNTHVVIKVSC